MSIRLLIAGALTLLGLMLSSVSQAQCNRYQWYGVESFVYFQVDSKTALAIYGYAGHAYASPTSGSSVAMAHMGPSFVPTRWEVIHSDPAKKSIPNQYMSANMKRIRTHNPCDTPEFYEGSASYLAGFQFTAYNVGTSSFYYLDGGVFNISAGMATLNSNPGEWVLNVGVGEAGVITGPVQFTKGFFYSVQDANYATNPPIAFPGAGQGGSTWGNAPTKWGGGPVEGGEGGITAQDLNDQNVNQTTWWQSLFQPSEEVWDAWVETSYEFRHWGPFGYMTLFYDLVDDYSEMEDNYVITFPTPPYGNLTMDAEQYSGVIIFFRHLAAGGLWFVAFLGVRSRFIQKI